MHVRKRNTQRGFSLLELSIAAAIYSMGLGGVSLMMMLAVHGTAAAEHDTLAALHATSLAERIAMSPDAFGHYVFPAEPVDCETGPLCPDGKWATSGLSGWRTGLTADLPAGDGLVCRDGTPADGNADDPACDGTGAPFIKIFWRAPGEGDENVVTHRHVSRLPQP